MTTSDETLAAPVAVPTDMAALAAGLVTVAAWGSAFVGIRAAGEALSPGPLALGRLIVSLTLLGTVAAVRREPLPARRDLLWIAAFGVLWLAVYSVALNEAERRVDAGTAAMLVNTGPILIAISPGSSSAKGSRPGSSPAVPSPSAASSSSPSPPPNPERARVSASSSASPPRSRIRSPSSCRSRCWRGSRRSR